MNGTRSEASKEDAIAIVIVGKRKRERREGEF